MGKPEHKLVTAARDLIMELRGGHPEACDFCKQPYTETRLPEPEEAGDWACTECVTRWRKEDLALRAKTNG